MGRTLPLLLLAAIAAAGPDPRAAAREEGDVRARFELALDHEAHGLAKEARAAHEAVLLLDPGHRASRRALGYARREGGWVPDDARLRELCARADASREGERRRAIRFLSECAVEPRALAALIRRVLLDQTTALRAAALEAMRPAGKEATRRLVAALDSSSAAVRLRAIDALGRWGDAAAVPALRLRYRLAGGSSQGAWIGQTRQQAFLGDFDVEIA